MVMRPSESKRIRRVPYFDEQELVAYTANISYTMESRWVIGDGASCGTGVRGAGVLSICKPPIARRFSAFCATDLREIVRLKPDLLRSGNLAFSGDGFRKIVRQKPDLHRG